MGLRKTKSRLKCSSSDFEPPTAPPLTPACFPNSAVICPVPFSKSTSSSSQDSQSSKTFLIKESELKWIKRRKNRITDEKISFPAWPWIFRRRLEKDSPSSRCLLGIYTRTQCKFSPPVLLLRTNGNMVTAIRGKVAPSRSIVILKDVRSVYASAILNKTIKFSTQLLRSRNVFIGRRALPFALKILIFSSLSIFSDGQTRARRNNI